MTCVYDDKILKAPPAVDESDRRIYPKRTGQSCSFPDSFDDSICVSTKLSGGMRLFWPVISSGSFRAKMIRFSEITTV